MFGMRRGLRIQRVQGHGNREHQAGKRLELSAVSYQLSGWNNSRAVGLADWKTSDGYFNAIPASAEISIAAYSLVRNFGYAAAATIAALSVESGGDGKYTGCPSSAACCSNVCRSSLLAATPPVTNNVATSYSRAAARVLPTRSSTIARWNDATELSVCWPQFAK